ncbi:hypothetical protein [Streptomyces ipomoeae]|uniref:hypothetical protein n=2 Tax=Streptomyces ipomoeae TaxID=103232 RepID=UPI0029A966BA|nr:hypothetical protein [Streptomyces ipomoeae]MDX2699879.1 hypothetical protein [Streptomyces ipomoeae]
MNPPASQPLADIQARLAATALGSWGIFEHGNDGSIIDITAEVRRLRTEEEQRAEALASTDDPTRLRWGLDDVMWGDDDSVIVMMSGPDREPYWLELDQERAAVLRRDLAGPDGEPEPGPRRLTPNEYTSAWHAVEGAAGEPGADPATVLHAVLRALGIDQPVS